MSNNKPPIEWPRWIMSSVIKHFKSKLEPHAELFIIGVEFEPPQDTNDFYELRLDGPKIRHWSHNFYRVFVEVSIIIQSMMTEDNLYKIYDSVGIAQQACSEAIPIYKLGDGPNDTGEKIGCLQVINKRYGRDQLEANHFGPVGPRQRLRQAAVEGHFDMLICT